MDNINIDFLNFEPTFHQFADNSKIDENYFLDTSFIPNSDKFLEFPLKPTLDLSLDESLNKFLEQKPQTPDPVSYTSNRKRGRKPIRPNDPIKKKTEEKDKYWLRSFRSYIADEYSNFKDKLNSEENSFWIIYLSSKGKPDKGNKFLSYGRRYKNYLFSQPSFVKYFQEWFTNFASQELSRKCKPGTDLWFVFYDYGANDLYNYVPHESVRKESSSSYDMNYDQAENQLDFVDNEAFIESLFDQM
ncbi:unnamed protein product [Blepharisma stoltei]|uniref:Uncharacterized protein n=1 Tax=Blepharisma stoltei TaxID=1481888 RepID=A0AAU9K5E9_9CILI|nr:unnamed protein product [Blepharisma stoltei]